MANKPIIIILEGPAGSGKTFAAEVLSRHGCRIVPRNLFLQEPGVRDYVKYNDAALRSQQKDLYNLTYGLKLLNDDPFTPVVIDRCFLSQLIYERLRERGAMPIAPVSLARVVEHLEIMSILLSGDYKMRKWSDLELRYKISEVLFLFVIMSPTLMKLIKQRTTTEKSYPFSALYERAAYDSVFPGEMGSPAHLCRIKTDITTTKAMTARLILTSINHNLEELGVQHAFRDGFILKGATDVSRS